MTANSAITENELAQQASTWLRTNLPSTWRITRSNIDAQQTLLSGYTDTNIEITSPSGTNAQLVMECKPSFSPKDAEQLQNNLVRMVRAIAGNIPVMVVSRWLSERTQSLLADQDINYLDLTGNAYLRIDNPAVFIRTEGAKTDPNPVPRGRARVQGGKSARLIRTLVDFQPPYKVGNLAEATELSPGYVSRLLDTLDRERLIVRSNRGGVEKVDFIGLIRRWAQTYDVFRTNKTQTFVAPRGPRSVLELLPLQAERTAVSGSFAASRFTPISGSALLVLYANGSENLAEELDLLPAEQGGNVALLQPFDDIIWRRTLLSDDAIAFVALPQVAVDCLTGNGRMPAEGDALLTWMATNEKAWRLPSEKLLEA
jgi:hypothetical protein